MALMIEDVLRFLPHRYPFLLVDRVLEIEKAKRVVCLKNVTYNEPFFQGHFPDLKVMPGVLIVEALAQAGGILLYNSLDDPEGKIVLLSKISQTKFRRPVVPGDQLRLEADLNKAKGRFYNVIGKAYVEGQLAAETELMAFLISLEEFHGWK